MKVWNVLGGDDDDEDNDGEEGSGATDSVVEAKADVPPLQAQNQSVTATEPVGGSTPTALDIGS